MTPPTVELGVVSADTAHHELVSTGRRRREVMPVSATFLDWTIDGVPLRQHLTEEGDEGQGYERVTLLSQTSTSGHEQIDRLLGRAWPDAKDGRTALLVCAECFSLGCGAITALVVFSWDTVQWRNLAHEFPWEDPTPSEFENPPVSFVFDRQQYTDLLLSLRARFDPDLATDPADLVPRADEVVDSRHTRHIWCWFSRAGDVDPRGKGGRT